jgi:hypothetical protein
MVAGLRLTHIFHFPLYQFLALLPVFFSSPPISQKMSIFNVCHLEADTFSDEDAVVRFLTHFIRLNTPVQQHFV